MSRRLLIVLAVEWDNKVKTICPIHGQAKHLSSAELKACEVVQQAVVFRSQLATNALFSSFFMK